MTARLTTYWAGITAFAGIAAIAGGATPARAATLTEGFENVEALKVAGSGWSFQNNSTAASGILFGQGGSTLGPAPGGTTSSFAVANVGSTTSQASSGAIISQWMLTPVLTYGNGGTVSFFTRTAAGSVQPDRLQVRFSAAGASTNVGATPTSVGDFTTLLLDINPTYVVGPTGYPQAWTQYTISLTGLSGLTPGRIGFRYFVENGGQNGPNSNIVGIDSLAINSSVAVPEPGTLALLLPGVLAGGIVIRRRRAAK